MKPPRPLKLLAIDLWILDISLILMSLHLPFEAPTALDSLQRYLPPFVVRLTWSDIRDYIIDGHVQRKVVLCGRFGSFGYTISMLSAEDTTVESLLNSRIPQNSVEPLYDGQASGCKR